jgi:hypothetical protein
MSRETLEGWVPWRARPRIVLDCTRCLGGAPNGPNPRAQHLMLDTQFDRLPVDTDTTDTD